MISIASNYAAADDDARESLKASTIQDTRKRNNNKRKSPLEEQHTPDMVATTFSKKGQSGQHGRGCGTGSGEQRSSTTPVAAPTAPVSYDEFGDMPRRWGVLP
jgi:hypothetical protein